MEKENQMKVKKGTEDKIGRIRKLENQGTRERERGRERLSGKVIKEEQEIKSERVYQ